MRHPPIPLPLPRGPRPALVAALLWGLLSWGCVATTGLSGDAGDPTGDIAQDGQADPGADAPPDLIYDLGEEGVAPAAACPDLPDGTPCGDRDPCTIGDVCLAGVCTGTAVDCSWRDGACVKGTCTQPQGECVALPVADGTACDDGDLYTAGEACQAGACTGGWAASCHGTADGTACDDGNPCTQDDRCGNSECSGLPVADGTACDDHDGCTTGDVCMQGQCRANGVDCSGLVTPCAAAACDPTDGTCRVTPRADGQVCEDGDGCTTGDACLGGKCLGVDQCLCRDLPDSTPCDDGRFCTEADSCAAELCVGLPVVCAPSNVACQVAACVEVLGGCADQPAPDGTACDDGDPCTAGEACQAGVCTANVNTCFCHDQPDGKACDDANPCTLDDACLGHACVGALRDCSAKGDGRCMQGVCDTVDGECVAVALPNGSTCDDGVICTLDDTCAYGVCRGAPMPCPGDACNVGVCEPATGACGFAPKPKGTPCDDGLACTSQDGCDGGVCKGGVNICSPCTGAEAAATCNDADACTAGTLCSPTDEGLACLGTVTDCSHLDDACTVTRCNPSNGSCSLKVNRPNGTACDDGNPCTADDACAAGVCKGTTIGTCGASFTACETAGEHRDALTAAPIALTAGDASLLGFIDPPGDEDWYALALQAGQVLSLKTRSHCNSALDTRLGLVAPDGYTLLADDDNGGGGGWSALPDVAVPATGTYFVVVNAFPSSGPGTYLLTVHAAFPTCSTNTDCGCAHLKCSGGACVPTMAGEVEPNDTVAGANALAYANGATVHGDVSTLDDEDWFRVQLPASTVLGLTAAPLCQSPVQVRLALFDDAGSTLVAEGVEGADSASSALQDLYFAEPGAYRVRVTGLNASQGPYLLTVSNDSCHVTTDCQCADQVCGDVVGGNGRCMPLHPSAEAPDGAAVPLELGQRLHGRIEPAYDEDLFTIFLAQGTYDLHTVPYCGSDLDTLLDVRDASGALIASGDDGDQGLFAQVKGLSLAEPATVTLRVRGHGDATGDYLVVVAPTP